MATITKEHGVVKLFKELDNGKESHLYFTSNEGLEEGDWYYTKGSPGRIAKNEGEHKVEYKGDIDNRYLRLVATTDPKLNRYIENHIGEEVDEIFPQIPQSFIESYAKNPVYTVLLEYESAIPEIDLSKEPTEQPIKLKLINNEVVVVEDREIEQ